MRRPLQRRRASGATRATYIRAAGGRLWHIQRRVTPRGCVDMLCGMMATGRTPGGKLGSGRFDRKPRWPEPRCLACLAKRDHEPVRRFRECVTIAFPEARGESRIEVWSGRAFVMALNVKVAGNGAKVYLPPPVREDQAPGIGRVLHYFTRGT